MMRCSHCGLASFRTSRFRPYDLARLFRFQLPVRCRICSERRYEGILAVLKLRRVQTVRRENEQGKSGEEKSTPRRV